MYWVIGLVGVVFGVSPWVFAYTDNNPALWTSIVLGVLTVLAAGYKAIVRDTANWEYWAAGIIGVAAIVAPFVLGFSTLTAPLWTSLVIGAALVILDGYQVFFVRPEKA